MSLLVPHIIAAGLIATFLIAFAKGAFGGGLAVVGIPILSLVMDPVEAVLVLTPLLPLMDLATLRVFPPSTWSKPDVAALAVGIFIGMLLAASLLVGLPEHANTLLIGGAIFLYAVRQLLLPARRGAPLGFRTSRAIAWGMIGGITTFLANAGQPPVAIYLTRRHLTKTVFAGTMTAVFAIANLARLPLMAVIGLDRADLLAYSLAMIPAIPLGTYAGKLLHDRLDRERLFRVIYLLLLAAGAKLILNGLDII